MLPPTPLFPLRRLALVAFGLQRLELKELFQLLISLRIRGDGDLFGGLGFGHLGRRLPTDPRLRHHSSEGRGSGPNNGPCVTRVVNYRVV